MKKNSVNKKKQEKNKKKIKNINFLYTYWHFLKNCKSMLLLAADYGIL